MTERSKRLDDLMPLIQERLAEGQSVAFFPRGISMLPLLRQGKDAVELSPLPEKLRKYDLPLYRRDDGHYVLHRVVAVGEKYICCGDNQLVLEHGLRHDQMIALVTAVIRDGKRVEVDDFRYRLYCRILVALRPLRVFRVKCITLTRRIFRRELQ